MATSMEVSGSAYVSILDIMSPTLTLEISSSLAQIFLTKSRSVIIPTGCSLLTMITELMCLSVMRRAASVAPRLMSIVTTSFVIILRTGLVICIHLITKLKSLVSDQRRQSVIMSTTTKIRKRLLG